MGIGTKAVAGQEAHDTVLEPKMYAVIIYDDDITAADFVVDVLVRVFHKSSDDAYATMTHIDETGQGVAGVYTFDIAVTKKMQADQMAACEGFPLHLVVGPVE